MRLTKRVYLLIIIVLILVLPEMLLLMSRIDADQGRLEITFYEPLDYKTIRDALIEIQPEYYLAMSTSFESTINDKVVKAIYSKGNIGYFLNGNYGEVLDDDKVYIGKDVSYDIFKTTDIVGMDIIVDKKVRRITSVSDLEKIDYYDRGTQVVLSGKINSDIKFSKLILTTKDRKGKNITFENIRKYLDEESNIRCISRDEILNSINATRESMKLICILILALWVYKNHSVLNKIIIISFLAILVCFIYSMEWALLPIDLINENLVSLSYLIETITKAPDQMYKIMQTPMTIDTFKLLGISIVQISGYIIALAIVIANFTLKDIVKKECKNEKSSSVDYDADSCF